MDKPEALLLADELICIWPNHRISDVEDQARAAIAAAEGEKK